MLGPFATTSRLTPIHQMSLAVLSRAACASMSTTTTTTTTRDRGDRYGPMEWAQLLRNMGELRLLRKWYKPIHFYNAIDSALKSHRHTYITYFICLK